MKAGMEKAKKLPDNEHRELGWANWVQLAMRKVHTCTGTGNFNLKQKPTGSTTDLVLWMERKGGLISDFRKSFPLKGDSHLQCLLPAVTALHHPRM